MRTDATSPPLSPELALVDSGLAWTARSSMPAGGEGEAWRLRFPTRPLDAVLVVPPPADPRQAPGHPYRLRTLVGAGLLCAAATAVAYATADSDRPYLVEDDGGPMPRVVGVPGPGGVAATSTTIHPTAPAPPASSAPKPSAASRRAALPVRVTRRSVPKRLRPIRSVVRLGWSARPEATYYRVRIRRATARATEPVLEIWTVKASVAVQLSGRTAAADARLLAPGRYRWTVHPVSARRFGDGTPAPQPVASGEFEIGKPS